jgi:hypothetical protein
MRFPDKQAPKLDRCDPDPTHMVDPAKTLYAAIKTQRGAGALTVGMGDNFNPEFDARTFDGPMPGAPAGFDIPRPGKPARFGASM